MIKIPQRTEKVKSVFILGAGFSRAVSNQMPLLEHLSDFIKTHPAFKNDPNFSRLLKISENNIELWLTYLTQDLPWLSPNIFFSNKSLFLMMVSNIQSYLIEKQIEARNGGVAGLHSLIRYWRKHKSSIITMNYDTLIEEVYKSASISLSFQDLYPVKMEAIRSNWFSSSGEQGRRDLFKLYKLHGSINWYYSGRENFFGETIYFQDYEISLEAISGDEEDVKILKSGKQILIIPPVADKSFYYQNETLKALWTEAFYKLYEAERIYCIGYSFPEIDNLFKMFLFDSSLKDLNEKKKRDFVFVNPQSRNFEEKHGNEFSRIFDVRYIPDMNWIPIVIKELEENEVNGSHTSPSF